MTKVARAHEVEKAAKKIFGKDLRALEKRVLTLERRMAKLQKLTEVEVTDGDESYIGPVGIEASE